MHATIRSVLGDTNWDTFLQGSYRNGTAIADINDVDIVSRLKSTRAPLSHQNWDRLFAAIASALRSSARISGTVSFGDKCVKLTGSTGGLNADIVPAAAIGTLGQDPIAVYSRRQRQQRSNYPRTHYDNGVRKQARTSDTYKATVRLFKRWVRQYPHYASFAPSFYIECAVHHADDRNFNTYLPRSFYNVGRQILTWSDYAVILSVAGDKDIRVDAEWEIRQFQFFKSKLATDVRLVGAALAATTQAQANFYWKSAFGE